MKCRTTHYACDCVLKRLNGLRETLEAARDDVKAWVNYAKARRQKKSSTAVPGENGIYDSERLLGRIAECLKNE